MCPRSLVLVAVIVVAGAVTVGGAVPDENQSPLADAGLDQSATVGSTVYLDGGGSLDPDGEIVAYRWEIERPDGSVTTPTNASDPTTWFSPTVAGKYAITLSVTDDDGAVSRDTVYVTVSATPTETRTRTETTTPTDGSTTPASGTTPSGTTPSTGQTGSSGTQDGSTEPTPGQDSPDGPAPTGRIVGPDSVTFGSTAAFSVEAYDSDGEIQSYQWSFGGSSDRVTRSFDEGNSTKVTFSVRISDDDGQTTTVEKTVTVAGTSERESLPIVRMTGDTVVRSGERVTFTLLGRDPDGAITEYLWKSPASVMGTTGPTLNKTFTTPGNYTIRAAAEDNDGGVAWATKQVRVLPSQSQTDEPPIVSLTGPKTASKGSTPKYEVEATDPDGGPVAVEWSPAVTTGRTELGAGTDPNLTESAIVSVPLSGEVGAIQTVTATVTDDEGNEVTVEKQTRLTAVTQEAPERDRRPTVGNFGIEYKPDSPTQTGDTDVIRGKYQLSVEVFHSGGEDVTVTWHLGDGTVKTQTFDSLNGSRMASVSHTFLSDAGGTNTYEITAEVTDQSGNTQRYTTTQTVTTLATADAIQFSVSSRGTTVEDGGALEVRPDDSLRFEVWSYQPFEIEPGDGTVYTGSGSTRTASFSHHYSDPGRYVALATSIQGQSGVGAARVVIVVERETYTEYQYQQQVSETEKTVASSEPAGNGWKRGEVDRTEETMTGETRSFESGSRASAPSASDPAVTWVRQRTYQESEQYLSTRVGTDSPGSDWWIEDRRWSSKTVTSTSTETQWRESKFSYSGSWSLVGQRTESSTERTESTDDPGRGWSKAGDTGDVKLTGYESTWYDSKGNHGDAWYTGKKRCEREASVSGRSVCVDYGYKYTYPDYDSVYEWTKTTSDTDYKYKKETQTTETVWKHKWGTTKTRDVTYVEYEKQTSTTYYAWSRERTVAGDWVWKLVEPDSGKYVPGTLQQFERHCDAGDGHFREEKCD